jgi:hypothetical protein
LFRTFLGSTGKFGSARADKGAGSVNRFFKADEWERRRAPEQIYQCRIMAEELLILSARCPPNLRGEYVDLAKQWSKLAVALEKTLCGI